MLAGERFRVGDIRAVDEIGNIAFAGEGFSGLVRRGRLYK
jgi:hypothetical protein